MASRVSPERANPRFSDVWPLFDRRTDQPVNRDVWLSLRYEYVSMEYCVLVDRVVFQLPAATLLATGTVTPRMRDYPALSESADCTTISRYARDYYEWLRV